MPWVIGRLSTELTRLLSSPNLVPFVVIALAAWSVAWAAGVGLIWWTRRRLTDPLLWALAAPTGLAVTAALWASLISLKVSPTSRWLLVVPVMLALGGWWRRRAPVAGPDPPDTRGERVIPWIPVAVVWAVAFVVQANLLRDNLVYPGYDAQSTAYFGWLFERENAYPIVHPYPWPTLMSIDYPPAFEIIYVVLHQVLPWPFETMQMGAAVAVSTLFSVAVAGLVFAVTGSTWWMICGGVASLARGFLFQIISGNTTEALAMVGMAAALGWIALGIAHWETRTAVLTGLCSAVAILSNGKVFQLYFVTLALSSFWWIVSRSGERIAVTRWLGLASIACAAPVVPWAWHSLANLHLMSGARPLSWHPVVHLWRNVTRWNEPVLVALALAGALAALVVGSSLARLLALHGLACLAIAQYWWLLQLWSPPWFAIKTIPFDDWLGTDRMFATPLLYPYTNEIGFIGYTITFPVLAAFLGYTATRAARGMTTRIAGVSLGPVLGGLCLAAGALFAANAPRSMQAAEPLAYQLLSPSDHRVLKWVARHTSPVGTFLLNPWHMSAAPEGNWAAVVANRPTVFFRGANETFNTWVGPPPSTEELKTAYETPEQPDSLARIRAAGVTHVFVPGSLSPALTQAYERASAFAKVTEEIAPGGRRSAIFAVK